MYRSERTILCETRANVIIIFSGKYYVSYVRTNMITYNRHGRRRKPAIIFGAASAITVFHNDFSGTKLTNGRITVRFADVVIRVRLSLRFYRRMAFVYYTSLPPPRNKTGQIRILNGTRLVYLYSRAMFAARRIFSKAVKKSITVIPCVKTLTSAR